MSLSGLAAGILHDMGDENVVSALFAFVAEHAEGMDQYPMFVRELRDYAAYMHNKAATNARGYKLIMTLAERELAQLVKEKDEDDDHSGAEDRREAGADVFC